MGVPDVAKLDNFAHPIGGHCCPFGYISMEVQIVLIGGFLAHIYEGYCSCVNTLVEREQFVEREEYTMGKYAWFRVSWSV